MSFEAVYRDYNCGARGTLCLDDKPAGRWPFVILMPVSYRREWTDTDAPSSVIINDRSIGKHNHPRDEFLASRNGLLNRHRRISTKRKSRMNGKTSGDVKLSAVYAPRRAVKVKMITGRDILFDLVCRLSLSLSLVISLAGCI